MTRDPGEGTIFERSTPGRAGYALPFPDVAHCTPESGARPLPVELPEVSELEVVRHYTILSRLNQAADLAAIPLGSATMKYAPRINEELARIPGLVELHPDLPAELCQGAMEILHRFERSLSNLSGLDDCSAQTGAAPHAQFAGLSLVRAFHEKHGSVRRIVLVPETVPASARAACALAGYQAMEVKISASGIVNPELVREAIDLHGRDIAAMIVSTPNTLGLFQPHIAAIAEQLHAFGAQLYLDGGNMNALIGIVKPSEMGVDVMHFDLRTFSAPHGGGGPAASAIAVRGHLAPYLPGPRVRLVEERYVWETPPDSIGKVGNAYGGFPTIVRALAYLAELGTSGLKRASRASVLNANYLKRRLSEGLTPTVGTPSFNECAFNAPSGGTMILEPTETESLHDLDRLAIAILELNGRGNA